MKFENIDGWGVFSDLGVPHSGGVRLEYFSEKFMKWLPCCIFASLDERTLFAPNDLQTWNRGTVMEGTVMQTDMLDDKVFWNYFVSFTGAPRQPVCRVRKTTFENSGANPVSEECVVVVDPGRTVFINNWENWSEGPVACKLQDDRQADSSSLAGGLPVGWTSDRYREGQKFLTIRGGGGVPPIYHTPGLSGVYDLYVCIKGNVCEFLLELPGMPHLERVRIDERMIPANKFWKEVLIGRYAFSPTDRIGIHQAPSTVHNPLHRFGDLHYLKLAPRAALTDQDSSVDGKGEIVFYSEPYSLAYYHELQTERMVEGLVEEYASLGIDKIVCQLGRGGSNVIYPSSIVKPARSGAVIGDDRQSSNGVAEMTEAFNIMEILPSCCHRKGIKFIANIGLNIAYAGSTLESAFSAEHPEYHHAEAFDFLDFSIPAVRDYVVEILMELSEYRIDGLSVDHCRYPYAQTSATILAFHRSLVKRLGRRRRELEINIRFPASHPDYYQALQALLEEDLVDSIIPSRSASLYPPIDILEYAKLCKTYEKKIYGNIDFNTVIYADKPLNPRPAELRDTVDRYLKQGADGLFFYQSEMLLSNVFQRNFVKALKGGLAKKAGLGETPLSQATDRGR